MRIDIQTASNIALSVLSLILVVISLCSSIKAIKQNNKSIEIATRPYVVIYIDFMNIGIPVCQFVIRNTGASPARITALDYNYPVWNINTDLCDFRSILANLMSCTIAPGQKFLLPFRLSEAPKDPCEFTIRYSCDGRKEYSDTFVINPAHYEKMNKVRFTDKDMQHISMALQEISERLM